MRLIVGMVAALSLAFVQDEKAGDQLNDAAKKTAEQKSYAFEINSKREGFGGGHGPLNHAHTVSRF